MIVSGFTKNFIRATEKDQAPNMTQCNNCGKNIAKATGVHRVIRTGQYAGGRDYLRNVNLCPRCDANQDSLERSRRTKKTLLVLGTITGLIVGCVYILFFR
jgi:hypothetical protein